MRAALGGLLIALVDDRVPKQNGAELYKAVNELVMSKLLPNCDRSATTCSLIGFLQHPPEAVAAIGSQAQLQFVKLVAHCMSVLAEELKGSMQVKLWIICLN